MCEFGTLWAQAQPAGDSAWVAQMALRRWFSGSTPSSPLAEPSLVPLAGLISGLAALLVLAMIVQGPGRALGQCFDVAGHLEVLSASSRRLRRAGRVGVILFLCMVASWTAWQARHYDSPPRAEELARLIRLKSVKDLAIEQGQLAAVSPFCDLCGLSSLTILLVIVAGTLFRDTTERWNEEPDAELGPLPGWATPAWCAAALYLLYVVAVRFASPDGFPVVVSLWVEPLVVPLLMLACDGLILAWVLVDLARARSDAADETVRMEAVGAVWRQPAACLACFVALPARYVLTAAFLLSRYLPASTSVRIMAVLAWLLLGWGAAILQAASLPLLPLVGAAALDRDRGGLFRAWLLAMRAQGGRLVAVVGGGCVLCGSVTSLVSFLVLQSPANPWLLAAADSYCHYAVLPIALAMLATLIELVDRSVPAPQWVPASADQVSAGPLDPAIPDEGLLAGDLWAG